MASNLWLRIIALSLLCGTFALPADAPAQQTCRQPEPVCGVRDAVFLLSSFEPFASAVRLSETRLVTNRHAVADRETVRLTATDGRQVVGTVVPTAYDGDLVLIEAEGLGPGPVVKRAASVSDGPYFTVAADATRKAVRAYPPGRRLVPTADRPRARLHHTAYSQPGNSGGALVDETGALVGVIASGGEGRFEAMPVGELDVLEKMSGPEFADRHKAIGTANRVCMERLEVRSRGPMAEELADEILDNCSASANRQLFDMGAQALARSRHFDRAIGLSKKAVERDPSAINSRLTLVIALHIAGRYAEEVEHLRFLVDVAPEEPSVARFAIQAGKWAGDDALAQLGLELVRKYNPAQLQAAERFLKADIPPPRRRAPAPRQ